MSGILIKDTTTDVRNSSIGWAGCPIDTTGLELAHFFGGTLAQSLKNYAPGKGDSIPIGVPTVNAHSLTLKHAGGAPIGLQTQMQDAANITLIAVYESADDGNAFIVSNYGGPRALNSAQVLGGSTSIQISAGTAGDSKVTERANRCVNVAGTSAGVAAVLGTAVNIATPLCQAMRWDDTERVLRTVNLTSGEVANSAVQTNPADLGSPMRIVAHYETAQNAYSAQIKVYAVLGFSRKLSDAELTLMYGYLKTYCARRSITI